MEQVVEVPPLVDLAFEVAAGQPEMRTLRDGNPVHVRVLGHRIQLKPEAGNHEWIITRRELLEAFEHYRVVLAEGGEVTPSTLHHTKKGSYFAMLFYAAIEETRRRLT